MAHMSVGASNCCGVIELFHKPIEATTAAVTATTTSNTAANGGSASGFSLHAYANLARLFGHHYESMHVDGLVGVEQIDAFAQTLRSVYAKVSSKPSCVLPSVLLKL